MNYGTIKNYDIANGTGVRVSLFVSGEFIEAEKDLTLEFRGSRNQRILHLDEIRQNAKN